MILCLALTALTLGAQAPKPGVSPKILDCTSFNSSYVADVTSFDVSKVVYIIPTDYKGTITASVTRAGVTEVRDVYTALGISGTRKTIFVDIGRLSLVKGDSLSFDSVPFATGFRVVMLRSRVVE